MPAAGVALPAPACGTGTNGAADRTSGLTARWPGRALRPIEQVEYVAVPGSSDLPPVVGRDHDRRLFIDRFAAAVAEGGHRHAVFIGNSGLALQCREASGGDALAPGKLRPSSASDACRNRASTPQKTELPRLSRIVRQLLSNTSDPHLSAKACGLYRPFGERKCRRRADAHSVAQSRGNQKATGPW